MGNFNVWVGFEHCFRVYSCSWTTLLGRPREQYGPYNRCVTWFNLKWVTFLSNILSKPNPNHNRNNLDGLKIHSLSILVHLLLDTFAIDVALLWNLEYVCNLTICWKKIFGFLRIFEFSVLLNSKPWVCLQLDSCGSFIITFMPVYLQSHPGQ